MNRGVTSERIIVQPSMFSRFGQEYARHPIIYTLVLLSAVLLFLRHFTELTDKNETINKIMALPGFKCLDKTPKTATVSA